MNEEEREIVKKFERLYLKDFNNEKITNEDRLSYIECALMSNLIEKLQKENEELKEEKEQAWEEWNNLEQGSYETEQKLKQQIKKSQKENEELKEERQIVGIPVRNKRDGRIGIVLHQWESGSVAVLESINPRVINTHNSWNTLEIVTDEVKQTQTKCETIPVSLVKDKIEELKNISNTEELEDIMNRKNYTISELVQYVLQELLEGRRQDE